MNINTYKMAYEIMAKIAAHEWSTTDIADAIDKHGAARDDAIRRECADRAELYMLNIFAKDIGYDNEDLRLAITVEND